MGLYTVKQGDHISGIADSFGFSDYKTVWDHPNNANLKKRRAKPHVLFPGDLLYIPDREFKHISRQTDKKHSFRLSGTPLKIRVALKDFDDESIAGLDCILVVDGMVHKLKSGIDGIIEAIVPKNAKIGRLLVPSLGLDRALAIGHLDPHEEDSGCLARLINLGYCSAVPDRIQELSHAIEEFQCDHKLKITGELDAATRSKLVTSHGV